VRTKHLPAPSPAGRKGLLFGWVLAACLALAGCAGGVVPSSSSPTSTPTAVAATPSGSSVQLTGDDGTVVTIADSPQRVVSLTPATTELAFALGAGDRLKGRTASDDYPAEAAQVPAVASFNGVVIEQVVAINPDLVLAGGNGFTAQADIDRLRQLGYPVLVVYAQDVPGVLADIRLVGRALGAADEADRLTGSMQAQISEVQQAVATLARPRTFYEIGYQPDVYGPAPDSFVANMVELAGGDAVTTSDPAVFSISLEQLVAADPQLIVLGDAAYGTCPADVAARSGWSSISAVADGRIVPVDDTIVTRPGPRLADGLAALALAIHPDAQIVPPSDAQAYCTTQPSSTP
jgi:iron complex transport system substrate-binding protein